MTVHLCDVSRIGRPTWQGNLLRWNHLRRGLRLPSFQELSLSECVDACEVFQKGGCLGGGLLITKSEMTDTYALVYKKLVTEA